MDPDMALRSSSGPDTITTMVTTQATQMSMDPTAAENNWGILSFLDNFILNFLMKYNGMKVSYII